jgi:hypothetical protein
MAHRTLCASVAVLIVLLVGVGPSLANTTKVEICHFQEDEGKWKKISVAGNAPAAHIATHDDGLPGGVTSITDTQLDGDCAVVVTACGNCLARHDGAGCENAACQATVCAFDDFCCTNAWDNLCIIEAASVCGPAVCTGAIACGNCFDAHDGTGCERAACEAIVCALDAFCCDSFWDGLCAVEAIESCGEAACTP